MKTKKPTLFFFIVILSLLLTSCGTGNENFDAEVATAVVQTQTAMATDSPPPAPTAVPAGDYQPISEQDCFDLNASLSQQTGIMGEITNPEPFDDYVSEKTGFGCKISITTTGADTIHDQLGAIIPDTLDANGWVEDGKYTFPGIGGLASAYRKGNLLCLTASYVEPWEKNLCEENEDFFTCLDRLPSEQIRYGYDLNCAQAAP